MPEAEPAGDVRVALDELGQPVPRVGVPGRRLVLDHRGDEVAGERLAEHRGPAEQRAVGGAQPVDAARDDRLDGLRQLVLLRVVGVGARRDELLEEERVAAGAAGDRVGLVVGDVSARRRTSALASSGAERLEPHRHGRRPAACPRRRRTLPGRGAGSRTRTTGAPRDARARWRRSSDEASSIQCASSKRSAAGPGRSRCEQGLDGAVEARAPERRLELVDLAGRRDGHVERNREQGEPRQELGRDVVEAAAQRAGRRCPASRRAARRSARAAARGRRSTASRPRTARRRRGTRSCPPCARAAPRAAATSRSPRRRRARRASRNPCAPARARPTRSASSRVRPTSGARGTLGRLRPDDVADRERHDLARTCPSARTRAAS